MAKINFDAKQFLLQHGEHLGLGVAGFLTALMLLFGLFWPGSGVFGPSANANAGDLQKKNEQAANYLKTNKPTPEELKKLITADPKLMTQAEFHPEDPTNYQVASHLFVGEKVDDRKRRAPTVKTPVEARWASARVPVKSHIITKPKEGDATIVILKGGTVPAGAGEGMAPGNNNAQKFFGGMGNKRGPGGALMPPGMGGAGMAGGPGMGGPGGKGGMAGGMMPPGQGLGGEEPSDSKVKHETIKLDDLASAKGVRLAVEIRPVHMVVVAASFPWKEQLEEFRRALRFGSVEELLADTAGSAPQFLAPAVERRELKANGEWTGWAKLDFDKTVGPIMLYAGRDFEPDDPKYDPISFEGLVMQRPKGIRDNQYPNVEAKLDKLDSTLKALKEANKAQVAKPKNQFNSEDPINLFSKGGFPGAPGGPGGEGVDPSAMMPPGMKGPGGTAPPGVMKPPPGTKTGPMSPMPPMGEGSGYTGPKQWIPEYCLVRFLDPTVQPGKTYSYQIRIRMANPNYKREDVAWASLAKDEDIKSEPVELVDDSKPKGQEKMVRVEPDVFLYAVDQAALKDNQNYAGSRTAPPDKANQTFVQIHEWAELITPDQGQQATGSFPVGDWVIGERLAVTRGEYIARRDQVEVPTWVTLDERFALKTFKKSTKIPVVFTADNGQGDSLLVDFTGGDLVYSKLTGMDGDKPTTANIKDKMPTELLMLVPKGGKMVLAARDSDADANDDLRKERYGAWKERLKEVKENKSATPAGPKPPGGNPFGPGAP